MQTTQPAPTQNTDRVWINANGETRCDVHAGHYLTTAINAAPHGGHHLTALADWVAATTAEATCETCPAT
ncbi:hypothetical protein [Nesterenkonia sp. CF4.4]|uniref:hypothetical protein n=1 Tax=Nesterenkonia sp. CF4.4 TaxID=3373079 RepID=UPI003EE7DAEF